MSTTQITEIIGLEVSSVEGMEEGSNRNTIKFTNGTQIDFYLKQDSCENVEVNDVIGDPEDLIGGVLLLAEERDSTDQEDSELENYDYPDCGGTWTFYEFATIKGSVTVRWLGSSNGYYSESVSWRILTPKEANN